MCEWCCENCFEDIEIVNFIKNSSDVGNCDYCKSEEVYVALTSVVGDFIREGIDREFEPMRVSADAKYHGEDLCGDFNEFSIEEILVWELGIFSVHLDDEEKNELLKDLINESGPSHHDIANGDVDWIVDESLVYKGDFYKIENTGEYQNWEVFKNVCKYHNRYFDLLGDCYSKESLLCGLKFLFEKMTIQLEQGTILFRARGWTPEDQKEKYQINYVKELAPAPSRKTQDNRMSPVGISYMYLGNDISTCIKEVSSRKIEPQYIVGKFKTHEQLKILDLTLVPKFVLPSCFSKEFDYTKKWLTDFIEKFEAEISIPLDDDNKAMEYIATQVLAEYIRKIEFQGIAYKSSYNSEFKNYVLFCTVDEEMFENHDYHLYGSEGLMPPFTHWLELIDGAVYTIDLIPRQISANTER